METFNVRKASTWKTLLISGAVVGGGLVTVAAGDSYFEISKNLEIFTELYKELNVYYVDDTAPGKLMKTGIDAMLASLDPYTQYIPESDMEDYRFMTTGQYGGMVTTFVDKGDHYLLNGAKMWISNSPLADIAVVWAKAENTEGRIHGLIVERGMEGFTTPTTHGKLSLRASPTGELVFDNVKVPKANLLPNKSGLGAPLGCLDSARYGIAWGTLGVAMECYDVALRYSQQRIQFGKPIGQFQLTQKKLAEMITEITKAQLLTWRLGVLRNEGRATTAQISMAKRNNVALAMSVAREARQILGGMGITNEYPIMRHMMNLESVVTYEGTHDIHLLITGMEVTGLAAFK